MTFFRGTDRIRSALTSIGQAHRHIRPKFLNGMTAVQKWMQILHNLLFRKYRIPLMIVVGTVALVAAGISVADRYIKDNTVSYYSLALNGQPVGDISDPQLADRLLAETAERLEEADTEAEIVLGRNDLTYVLEKGYKKQLDDAAVLKLVADRLVTETVGIKVLIDGEIVGIVRDRKTADALLQRVKNKYSPEVTPKKNAPEVTVLSTKSKASVKTAEGEPERLVTSVYFAEKVTTVQEPIEPADLSDPEELYAKLTEGEPIPRTYTVQKGDCIGCIASKLKVSETLIYDKNPWIEGDKLDVGDVLDLSEEEPPILTVKSVEQVTEIEAINPPIEYKTSEDMKVGKSKLIRQGTPGSQEVTYRLIKRNGALVEEEIIHTNVLEKPVPTIILKGTKVIRGEGSGKFSWPVSGARITSYMGKRWGRMHNGLDIVGKKSIMASDEGVVEFAGYKSGGLGNAIIINHNNGFKTVYGHLKSINVKKGQIVEKGEVIAIMGSTGRSTGTHLHFEIHLNGKLQNPTSYL